MSEYKMKFKSDGDAAKALSELYDFADSFLYLPSERSLSVRTGEENGERILGIKRKFCKSDEA